MKRIVVEYGEVRRIAALMGCTCAMVSYSLTYRKNSRLARAIRKMAIQRGGVEIVRPETDSHETEQTESV